MTKKRYTCGQIVVARRLGDDKEYKVRICGIASYHPETIFYILEMIDPIPGQEKWTHFVLTDACIDAK